MAVYGDGVFEDDSVQSEVPAQMSDEDRLRQMGSSLGLFSDNTTDDAPVGEPVVGEEQAVDTVEPEVVPEVATPPESYSFKTESDFQEAALKALEGKLGVPIDAVVEMLNDFGGYRNQQLIEQQKAPLKSEWGDEFEDRYAQVVEKYETLSPEMQKALDNTEGAKLIWAMIAQMGGSSVPSPPRFDRKGSTTNRSSAKFAYTQSQIENMTMAEYQKNAEDINNAYARNLVDLSS